MAAGSAEEIGRQIGSDGSGLDRAEYLASLALAGGEAVPVQIGIRPAPHLRR